MANDFTNSPYLDRIHAALSDNLDGFNKSPEEFKTAMQDPAYVANVHAALADNLHGFTHNIDDFNNKINDPDKTPTGGPNYTPTKDPNVVIGKYGVPITMDDFKKANANGYAWVDFPAYANYVGGWAKPITDPVPIHPIYRVYGGTPNISGGDVAILAAKDNPHINTILQRNIAKDGEVPMYSAQDADVIRALIQQERKNAMASHSK